MGKVFRAVSHICQSWHISDLKSSCMHSYLYHSSLTTSVLSFCVSVCVCMPVHWICVYLSLNLGFKWINRFETPGNFHTYEICILDIWVPSFTRSFLPFSSTFPLWSPETLIHSCFTSTVVNFSAASYFLTTAPSASCSYSLNLLFSLIETFVPLTFNFLTNPPFLSSPSLLQLKLCDVLSLTVSLVADTSLRSFQIPFGLFPSWTTRCGETS